MNNSHTAECKQKLTALHRDTAYWEVNSLNCSDLGHRYSNRENLDFPRTSDKRKSIENRGASLYVISTIWDNCHITAMIRIRTIIYILPGIFRIVIIVTIIMISRYARNNGGNTDWLIEQTDMSDMVNYKYNGGYSSTLNLY